MKITITESRTAGEYTAAQVVEIDTSDRKLFQGVASPPAPRSARTPRRKSPVTSMSAAETTRNQAHAAFCERRFASELLRRIRWWKWRNAPRAR